MLKSRNLLINLRVIIGLSLAMVLMLCLSQPAKAQSEVSVEAFSPVKNSAKVTIEAFYDTSRVIFNAQSSYEAESDDRSVNINHQSWQFVAVDAVGSCQSRELSYHPPSPANRFLNLNDFEHVSQWYCFKVSDVLGNKGYLKFQIPEIKPEQLSEVATAEEVTAEPPAKAETGITVNQTANTLIVSFSSDNQVTWSGIRIELESECSEDNLELFADPKTVFQSNQLSQLTFKDNDSWYCFRAVETIEDQSGAQLQKLHFKAVQIQGLDQSEVTSTDDASASADITKPETIEDDQSSSQTTKSESGSSRTSESQNSIAFQDRDNSSAVVIIILALATVAVVVVIVISRRPEQGKFVLKDSKASKPTKSEKPKKPVAKKKSKSKRKKQAKGK